jgi:hypothetical protein
MMIEVGLISMKIGCLDGVERWSVVYASVGYGCTYYVSPSMMSWLSKKTGETG